jgi:TRAP-type C4-dicarboxylate transport system permease small subunit
MLRKLGSLLRRILFQVGHRSVVAAGATLILLVLLIAVDVTLRRVFNSPLTFSYEIIQFGLVIVVWGSVLYSTIRERHISIDVLVSRLPEKTRQVLRLTFDFVSALILLLIGWQSVTYAMDLRDAQRASSMLDIPLYPFVFIVALGAILAGLILLVGFVDSVRGEGKR